MSVNRKKRNRPGARRWASLLWGIFFFVLILWLAYSRAPQIEKLLDTPFSVKEWFDEKIESVFPGNIGREKPQLIPLKRAKIIPRMFLVFCTDPTYQLAKKNNRA